MNFDSRVNTMRNKAYSIISIICLRTSIITNIYYKHKIYTHECYVRTIMNRNFSAWNPA